MSQLAVGILGVGAFLPEEVRDNDWWSEDLVESWRRAAPGQANMGNREIRCPDNITDPGTRATFEAEVAQRHDPFLGVKQRRIMSQGMLSSEMELKAAKEAIDAAGVDPGEIDLLLVNSAVPDYLTTTNACALQAKLGLPQRSFALSVEAACNSFLLQLVLAQQMIASGQARYGLLVQSSAASRLYERSFPYSVVFGDGASAVVVGAVQSGRGMLGNSHRTDGARYDAVVTGVPGKAWYEEGRVVGYVRDSVKATNSGMRAAELAKPVMNEALAKAGVKAEDIAFYGGHQGSSYLRRVTQEYFGFSNARFIDTFSWTGNLSAVSVPLSLKLGAAENLLREGDLVAAYAGGVGYTWSCVVLRWGR